MAGRDKDIDPASELVEDDEEQALPDSDELELDIGLMAEASGRSRLAAPRCCAMPGWRRPRPASIACSMRRRGTLRRQSKEHQEAHHVLYPPTGHDTRIERVIAATATVEFVTTATETEALLLEANLINA